jgi:hypothetical protein
MAPSDRESGVTVIARTYGQRLSRMMAMWHAMDGLPEQFQVPEAERVTPWETGETVHIVGNR